MTEGSSFSTVPPSPGAAPRPARILVIDDVPEICEFYREACRRVRAPVDLVTETDGRRALDLVRAEAFHLVVSDYRMAMANGLEVLTAARERSPRCYRILMTGYNEIPADEDEVRAAGVDAYLQKPFQVHELVSMLGAFATENRDLIRRWREEAVEMERAGFVHAVRGARDA